MDSKQLAKYKAKAKDSFKTKKNIFLFSLVINNLEVFTKSDFISFKISDKLVKLYTTEYWQQPEETKINEISIKEIYNKIKKIESNNISLINDLEIDYVKSFNSVLSESAFIKLINMERCNYCGISKTEIGLLGKKRKLYKKSLRGWTLEIDRLNSNYEYFPENCVPACYWCNNAKTDEFTQSEFEEIGKVIKEIWKNRLK